MKKKTKRTYAQPKIIKAKRKKEFKSLKDSPPRTWYKETQTGWEVGADHRNLTLGVFFAGVCAATFAITNLTQAKGFLLGPLLFLVPAGLYFLYRAAREFLMKTIIKGEIDRIHFFEGFGPVGRTRTILLDDITKVFTRTKSGRHYFGYGLARIGSFKDSETELVIDGKEQIVTGGSLERVQSRYLNYVLAWYLRQYRIGTDHLDNAAVEQLQQSEQPINEPAPGQTQ